MSILFAPTYSVGELEVLATMSLSRVLFNKITGFELDKVIGEPIGVREVELVLS